MTGSSDQGEALGGSATRRAGFSDLGESIAFVARRRPQAIAVDDGTKRWTYGHFSSRATRAAHLLSKTGLRRGDRFAVLSENRVEYLELAVAAARAGAVLCALNWRLSTAELEHCIQLTRPKVIFVSRRHAPALRDLDVSGAPEIDLEHEYESRLEASFTETPGSVVEPEDGFLILYTSGTTGFPKGALISHRAEFARLCLSRIDSGLEEGDAFVAWAPMFHMVALEHALHVLALGGTVHVVDGADIDRIVHLASSVPQWWLVLLPGMIDRVVEAMGGSGAAAAPIKLVGALADLVSPDWVAETSRIFGARYWNTFGSTETGMLPFAGTRFDVGARPSSVAKAPNSLHHFRLVDDADEEVAEGDAGEVAVRGPTVFSGYWNAPKTNARDFRGGWFHMGDVFRSCGDGRYEYVDRVKYLIKTGAENVYPAEIERVLLADPRIVEAVVVRRPDAKWGEVPVAFVVCNNTSTTGEELIDLCGRHLARYKRPKEVRFVRTPEEFPRSTSGKIQRQVVEKWARD